MTPYDTGGPTNEYAATRPYCHEHHRAKIDIGGKMQCVGCIMDAQILGLKRLARDAERQRAKEERRNMATKAGKKKKAKAKPKKKHRKEKKRKPPVVDTTSAASTDSPAGEGGAQEEGAAAAAGPTEG